jgi:cytochrome c551/c552
MKKISLFASVSLIAIFAACGGPGKEENNASAEAPKSMVEEPPKYDPHRGEGKWTAENVNIKDELNQEWVTSGESIANVKCASCHKFTNEKLVGPGWKDVTKRRTSEWIMNFITNPDPMIDKDPEAQAMLELCLVRMPNQSLSDGEARNILEFMRKNDGAK